jgi:hypothetical protein
MSNVEDPPANDQTIGQGDEPASEKNWQLGGYPRLARMMSAYPETAIFRRVSVTYEEELGIENESRHMIEALLNMSCDAQPAP